MKENIKVKAFYNEKAEGLIRIIEENGILPEIYLIETHLAKQCSGFGLILKDLYAVLDTIEYLKAIETINFPQIVKQSLTFYAVITYGKCFADASQGRGTKLEKKDAIEKKNPELLSVHEEIINLRNNYVAHGALKGHEHNPIVASLNPDLGNKKIIEVYDNVGFLVDIDSLLNDFEELVKVVISYVEEKRFVKLEKIKEELSSIDIEEIYLKKISIPLDNLIEINAAFKEV